MNIFKKTKKIEDKYKKIKKCISEDKKRALCLEQVEFFEHKSADPTFTYDFKSFLEIVVDMQNCASLDCRKTWIKLINQIMRMDSSFKVSHYKIVMNIIFSGDFDDIPLKLHTISILTDNCTQLKRGTEVLNKQILFFLTFECLIVSDQVEILELINSFLTNFNNKSIISYFTYLVELILEIYCVKALYNLCVYIEMEKICKGKFKEKNNYYHSDILKKIRLYIKGFDYYLFNIKINASLLNHFLIMLCFCIEIDEEKTALTIRKYIDFKMGNSNILMNLLKLLRIEEIEKYFKGSNTIINLYENIYSSFIYDYQKKNSSLSLKNFKEFKLKYFGTLIEKISLQADFITKAVIILLMQNLEENKQNRTNFFPLLNVILQSLKKKYTNATSEVKKIILSFCEFIVDIYGKDMRTEWETIYDMYYTNDINNELYEHMLIKIINLDIVNNFKGRVEIIKSLLLKDKITYQTDTLILLRMKKKMENKCDYEKNIDSILVNTFNPEKIDINISNGIYSYLSSFLLLYKANPYTEKALNHFNFLCTVINKKQVTMRMFLNLISGILLHTSNISFFENIIKEIIFKIKINNINEISNNNSLLVFQRNIIYRLLIKLNSSQQKDKIDCIFKIINEMLCLKEESVILNLMRIFQHFIFFKKDRKSNEIFLSFSNVRQPKLITMNTIIILNSQKEKTYNSTFTDKYLIKFLLDALLNRTANVILIENILEFLSKSINRVFFLNIDKVALMRSFLMTTKREFAKFAERPSLIQKSQNIIVNCAPFIQGNLNEQISIIHHIIGKLFYFLQIVSINLDNYNRVHKKSCSPTIAYNRNEAINKSLRKRKNSKKYNINNNDSNISFSSCLEYLKIYLNILAIFLNSVHVSFNKEEDNFFKYNYSFNEYPIDLEKEGNNCTNKKLNKIGDSIINIIYQSFRVLYYKKNFVFSLIMFFLLTKEFFCGLGEINIIKIIYFLSSINYNEYEDNLFKGFNKCFTINHLNKIKIDKDFTQKESNMKRLSSFLIEYTILSYILNSKYSYQFHFIFSNAIKVKDNDKDLKTFLLLCKWLAYFKIKKRVYFINNDEIKELSNKSEINLIGNKNIISKVNNKIITRNSISYQIIENKEQVKKNINDIILNKELNVYKEDDLNFKHSPNSNVGLYNINECTLMNIVNTISYNPFTYIKENTNTKNDDDFISLIDLIPPFNLLSISVLYIPNNIAYLTRNEILKTKIDHLLNTKSSFNSLLTALSNEKNSLSYSDCLFSINYNLLQLLSSEDYDTICLVFLEEETKESNFINNFSPSNFNSKKFILYIIIHIVSNDFCLVNLRFNTKATLKFQKLIKANLNEELMINISNGLNALSTYLINIIIISHLIIHYIQTKKNPNEDYKPTLTKRYVYFNKAYSNAIADN